MNLKMGEKRVRGGRKMNGGEEGEEALIIPLECPRWVVSNIIGHKKIKSLSQLFFFLSFFPLALSGLAVFFSSLLESRWWRNPDF